MTIAFVGDASEEDDPSFARFRTALNQSWPADASKPTLIYRSGNIPDNKHLSQAIKSAIAERPRVLVLPTGAAAIVAGSEQHSSIVFASYPDPVRHRIVDTMRRPGRQTTGVSLFDALDLKRLELLKDAFPRVRTVAVLADSLWFSDVGLATLRAEAKHRLGLELIAHEADSREALDVLINGPRAEEADGWYIPPSYIAYLAEAQIIAGLRRLQRPAIHATNEEVAAGAVMAYSQDTRFAYDAMAELAQRVALGEDAGSIPVQRPYRYTLSVRIEPDAPWARIEPSVVRRADRVHRP